jgi:Cu2+-exporting ATPase
MTTTLPDSVPSRATEPAAECAHCGLPVPAGLRVSGSPTQFCCQGCRTAWALIHEAGLDGYYHLAERRPQAAAASGRSFAEFDHPAFQSLYVTTRPDGLLETSLYLEGVHCGSCVWLVERVPLAIDGVAHAELDLGRSLAKVAWQGERQSLSAIARFLDQLGYRPHPFRGLKIDRMRKAEDRAALARIGVAGAIAGNVMTLALALYAGWFGAMEPVFERYFRWVSLVLVVPAYLWPGRVFFRSAWAALRARTLHMDVPIAIALGAGFVRGAINTATDSGPVYFDGLATLIFLLLVGRFLQQRAQRAATDSAELLYSLSPSGARVVEDETIREIPTEALLPGMVLDVRASDTIAADGVVLSGHSEVDASLLTGESRPIAIEPGSQVFAGTLNRTAAFRMRVEQAGEESRIGQILRQVETGAQRRAPVVKIADRVAARFVAAVVLLAAVTWLVWSFRNPAAAADNAIALLIVTCPCALAMATPLAITVAIGRAARNGILIKGGDAIEQLAEPGHLILDKTGTVTEGVTALVDWIGSDDVKPLVLGLELHASHPVAEGFRRAWSSIEPAEVTEVRHVLGGGLEGRAGGHDVRVGAPGFILATAGDPNGWAAKRNPLLTPVLVAVDGEVVAVASFGDPIRPDAREALDTLRARGWTVELLSGDDPSVVRHVAGELGIPEQAATGAATPEEKLARIEQAGRTGATVTMVGDGVNDAAAIARADVGIGVRGGAEACLAAADVFLARPGLTPLVDLVSGSTRTLGTIRRVMGLSLAYNAIGATLAMTGHLDPLIAAILMPASSVTAILTAWRSRTFDRPAS